MKNKTNDTKKFILTIMNLVNKLAKLNLFTRLFVHISNIIAGKRH